MYNNGNLWKGKECPLYNVDSVENFNSGLWHENSLMQIINRRFSVIEEK